MKIRSLRLQAFGPYVEEQYINFQQFEKDRLYLIQGETGSGKTCILDAITFVLYGKSSSGERGEFEQMRCKMAPDNLETMLHLEIQIQQDIYRFSRMLERKKRRNQEYYWKMSCDVAKWKDNQFQPLFENCKVKMLEQTTIELLNLTHAQFIQVIMLPQGKFEQFLLSKSEEKQEILATLFQTQRWQVWIDAMNEQLKLEKENMIELERNIQLYYQQVNENSIQDLEVTIDSESAQIQQKTQQIKEIKEELKKLQAEYMYQQQRCELEKEYEEIAKEWDALQLEKVHIDKLRERLNYAKKIEGIQVFVDTILVNKESISIHQKKLDTLCQQMIPLQEKKTQIENLKANVLSQDEKQKEQEKIEVLEKNLLRYQTNAILFESIKTIEQSILNLQDELQKKEQELQCFDIEMKTLQKEQEYLQSNLQKKLEIEELLRKYEKAEFIYDKLQHEQSLQSQLCSSQSNMKSKILQQKEMVKKIDKELSIAREQFLNSSVEIIKSNLKKGDICPVCNHEIEINNMISDYSSNHIKHYTSIESTYNQEKQRLQQFQIQYESNEQSIQAFDLKIQNYEKEIRDLICDNFSLEIYTELKKQLEVIVLHTTQYDANSKKLHDFQNHKHILLQSCITLKQQIEEKQIEKQKLSGNIQSYIGDFEENDGKNLESLLETNKKMLQEQIRLENKIFEDEKEIELQLLQMYEKEKSLKDKINILLEQNKNLNATIYDTLPDFDIHAMKEMKPYSIEDENRISDFDHKYEKVFLHKQTLVSKLEQTNKQNINECKQKFESCQECLHKEIQELSDQRSLFQQKKQILMKIKETNCVFNEVSKTYLRKLEFVKALRGDHGLGIERYVLGIMLSTIIQATNQLLKRVHSGRYQIQRSNESYGKTRKLGLELNVYDTYSCTTRSVHSLSGGEKFLISLALSIGLSTIVQAQCHGIRIEFMFIDEGFGTLDEHSIQDALIMLKNIASSQTMIGLISHVEYLKEVIPNSIHITKKKIGSHITIGELQ